MSVALFGLSVAVALILTNLDNLALMVAMLARLSRIKVMLAFAQAQALVLLVSLGVAEGFEMGAPSQAGWLGIVPVLLGIRELVRRGREGGPQPRKAATLVALLLTFLSVSTDSLSIMAPLLADAAPAYRVAGMVGAMMAVAFLLLAGGVMSGGAFKSTHVARWLERLAPWVMIAVGAYVLLNTATDMV